MHKFHEKFLNFINFLFLKGCSIKTKVKYDNKIERIIINIFEFKFSSSCKIILPNANNG